MNKVEALKKLDELKYSTPTRVEEVSQAIRELAQIIITLYKGMKEEEDE